MAEIASSRCRGAGLARPPFCQSAIFQDQPIQQLLYFGLGNKEKTGVSAFGLASPNKKNQGGAENELTRLLP